MKAKKLFNTGKKRLTEKKCFNFFKDLFTYFYVFLCMLMWVYVHYVSSGATEGQVTSDLPEPGLQAIVSHLMWL